MTYTYYCKYHGTFEINISITEHKNQWECPTCGEESNQRILSAPNFNLTGTGWTSKKPAVKPANNVDYKGKGEGYI